MAGVKGKSGPPRNTNAAKEKNAYKTLWRRNMVSEANNWVVLPIERYVSALISDKPDATAGQRHVIQVAATAQGCILLILAELKRVGFTTQVEGLTELTPAARELPRFLGIELSALKTLGLGRHAKPTESLQGYLDAMPSEVPPETESVQSAPDMAKDEAIAASAPEVHPVEVSDPVEPSTPVASIVPVEPILPVSTENVTTPTVPSVEGSQG